MQNAQIAGTVIELTAGNTPSLFIQMVLFPLLYYVFQVGYAVIFILFYNLAKRKGWIEEDTEDVDADLLSKSKVESKGMDMKKKKKDTKAASNHEAENPAFEDTKSA